MCVFVCVLSLFFVQNFFFSFRILFTFFVCSGIYFHWFGIFARIILDAVFLCVCFTGWTEQRNGIDRGKNHNNNHTWRQINICKHIFGYRNECNPFPFLKHRLIFLLYIYRFDYCVAWDSIVVIKMCIEAIFTMYEIISLKYQTHVLLQRIQESISVNIDGYFINNHLIKIIKSIKKKLQPNKISDFRNNAILSWKSQINSFLCCARHQMCIFDKTVSLSH